VTASFRGVSVIEYAAQRVAGGRLIECGILKG